MRAGDGCSYAIIVQGTPRSHLPPLPEHANASYIYHRNECYDWGSVGWLLRSGLYNL